MKRQTIFLWVFWFLFALFLIDLLLGFTGIDQTRCIFASGDDFLADFLNQIRYVWNRNPYFDDSVSSLSEHIYPPFAYFLMLPFSLGGGSPPTLDALQSNAIVCASVLSWSLLCAFLLIYFLKRVTPNVRFPAFLALLFSEAIIYSIERGNLIWFSAIGSAVFFFFYESTSKPKRLLAALGISLAIGIKVYPVFFLVLWLRKKDLRILAFSILLSAVLGFGPLLVFHHTPFENALHLLQNIKAQESLYLVHSFQHTLSATAYILSLSNRVLALPPIFATVSSIFCFLLGGLCLFVARQVQERWVRLFLLATAPVFIQKTLMYYNLLLFLPAICAFLDQRGEPDAFDKSVAIAFAVLLTPLQFATPVINGYTLCLTPFLATVLVTALSVILIFRSQVNGNR